MSPEVDLTGDLKAIKVDLMAFLASQTSGIGEYELIQHLEQAGYFDHLSGHSNGLKLFYKHFITMHCLYALQRENPKNFWSISPLNIVFRRDGSPTNPTQSLPAGEAFLQDYYLDLSHFYQATEESVQQLTHQFWQQYSAWNAADDSLRILGLSAGANWPDIQAAYRRRVQQEHPDKGGDEESFRQLQAAYQQLKQVHKT